MWPLKRILKLRNIRASCWITQLVLICVFFHFREKQQNSLLVIKNEIHGNVSDRYMFNCENIRDILVIRQNLGGGRSKCVDIGVYNGQNVVIKRVAQYKYPKLNMHKRQLIFLKEILLSQQLNHPNIMKLMGYCVRSLEKDSYKSNPRMPDISAVYEFGNEFNITNISISVRERLRHALELATLLLYLHQSPLGSLIIGDFHAEHFLMANNSIKLIDLDNVHNIEYPCSVGNNQCSFALPCVKSDNLDFAHITNCTNCYDGVCKGYNEKFNIWKIHQEFFKYILNPYHFTGRTRKIITKLQMALEGNRINSKELTSMLYYANKNYNSSGKK